MSAAASDSSASSASSARRAFREEKASVSASSRASAFVSVRRDGNRFATMLLSWSGMNPEGVQDSSATYGSETGSETGSARVSATNAFVRDASVTVARRASVPGVGGAKRHRGGDAPSHVPSSRRRIPPRRLSGSDAEARAMPALEPRVAGTAGRLVVRRRWRSSVSRHPIPSARRWRGNARDAIRGLVRSQPRGRRYGKARACVALASRTHCARERGRVYGRARGPLCNKMRRDYVGRDAKCRGNLSPVREKRQKNVRTTKFDRSRTETRVFRARFLIDRSTCT